MRHPHDVELGSYEAWMRQKRGLSEATISCYRYAADEFITWLASNNIPLVTIRLNDVDRAIVEKSARTQCSRTTINNFARRVRAFLRFAEYRGWCKPNTAAAIIPPRVFPDEQVPLGPSRDDVHRWLTTTEGSRPVDKRDRAILMLFIAYGLRAGEVSGLQLDDLDWGEETLRVRRPKLGRPHLYPLSRGVAHAILRYIPEVRPPRPERTLFFTLKAPFRPLHQTAWPPLFVDG